MMSPAFCRWRALAAAWMSTLVLLACDDPAPVPPPGVPPDDVTGTNDDPRCPPKGAQRPRWLERIVCPRAFAQVAINPDTSLFARTSSVKFVIDLQDDNATYFIDGLRYDLHYNFCAEHLNKPGFDPVGTHSEFNYYQYQRADRRFLLGTITNYEDADVVALEFATGDSIQPAQVRFAFEHLQQRLYFGDELVYRPISRDHELAAEAELEGVIPIVRTEDLYANITYQPLNAGIGYGYLRLLEGAPDGVRPNEIVVLREAPNDLRPVGGVITEAFQTPLSHVNILSKNRGTPNMALRGVFEHPDVRALEGQLVRLEVTPQSWSLRAASLEEAEPYWEQLRPASTFVPPLDLSVGGLPDLSTLDRTAINVIGAKAANLAEMTHITPPVPLPDQAFAIPFSHYWAHMERNGLQARRDALLADPRFAADPAWRRAELQALRDAIEHAPMDPDLTALLYARARARWGETTKIRFRSSTNSEDLEGFNGAGLYRSESGQISGGRPLEDAVRYVWASLWTEEATAERDFYRIDHTAVAMAVLVHPAQPDEAANGVALTVNLFNPRRPGFFVNAQEGEASVTNPGPGEVPDQFILYTWYEEPEVEYLSYSNLTEDNAPVLSWEETLDLYSALQRIHQHFRAIYDPAREDRTFGMDVEFKLLKPGRTLQIKQARPIPAAR